MLHAVPQPLPYLQQPQSPTAPLPVGRRRSTACRTLQHPQGCARCACGLLEGPRISIPSPPWEFATEAGVAACHGGAAEEGRRSPMAGLPGGAAAQKEALKILEHMNQQVCGEGGGLRWRGAHGGGNASAPALSYEHQGAHAFAGVGVAGVGRRWRWRLRPVAASSCGLLRFAPAVRECRRPGVPCSSTA